MKRLKDSIVNISFRMDLMGAAERAIEWDNVAEGEEKGSSNEGIARIGARLERGALSQARERQQGDESFGRQDFGRQYTGKHFNPIEAAFSKVKTLIRNSYTNSVAAEEKRHRYEIELRLAIQMGCARLTAEDMKGYWAFRGTRRCFTELYPNVQLD